MKSVTYGFLVTVLLLIAPCAFAQVSGDGPCGDTATPCVQEPPSDGTSGGGDFVACSAYGKLGQRCWTSEVDPWIGFRCKKVERSAGCYCDTARKKVTGYCTYQP
ncbi:MAG TPA: hypothetical protein VF698_05415 [Thermoanaerobaculia bacterium]|jgi:hypothetical protein